MKTGKPGKKGIDQLNTAAEQRYLGTYAKKFLIGTRSIPSDNQALAELAEAHKIEVITLPSISNGRLSEEDQHKLATAICKSLRGK